MAQNYYQQIQRAFCNISVLRVPKEDLRRIYFIASSKVDWAAEKLKDVKVADGPKHPN